MDYGNEEVQFVYTANEDTVNKTTNNDQTDAALIDHDQTIGFN
jgi:hypothetical protein